MSAVSSLDELLTRLFRNAPYERREFECKLSKIYMSDQFVVKIVTFEYNTNGADFVKECGYMRHAEGPFVMPLIECGHYKEYGYIKMARGKCNALDYVPQSEGDFVSFVYQLYTAVIHLHRKRIVHYDIKPKNIVLMNGLRLIDFGISEFFPTHSKSVYAHKVTYPYRSPEICDAIANNYSEMEVSFEEASSADVWAAFTTILSIICEETYVKIPRYGNDDMEFNVHLKKHIVRPWTLKRHHLTRHASGILSDAMIHRLNEMATLSLQSDWRSRGTAEDVRDIIYRVPPVRMGPILNVRYYWDSMGKAMSRFTNPLLCKYEETAAKVLYVLLMDMYRGNAIFTEADLMATAYVLASTTATREDIEYAFGPGTYNKVLSLTTYTNGHIIPRRYNDYNLKDGEEAILARLTEDMK